MKNVYFASSLMWDAPPREIVRMAVKYDVGGIELWAQQAETQNMDLIRLKDLTEEAGLSLVVHAKSWDLNFAALNRAIREASVKEIKDSIDIAYFLDAKEVTVHPPRYTLREDEKARDRAYESIREFTTYAVQKGITVSMEIMEHIPKEMAVSPEGMRSIVRDMDRQVTYTVDLAHCLTEEEFWENIDIMGKVSKVHVTNKSGKKLHTPLPDGDFHFENIFPRLCSMGLPMVIEGFEEGDKYSVLIQNLEYIKWLKEKNYEKENSGDFSYISNPGSCRLQF